MTIQTYALVENLPPPVTSGTGIQSFTDVMTGEVWIAKNGVYGGNWYRARDVVHYHAYRATAYTMSITAGTIFPCDTPWQDTWGFATGSPNYAFTAPVPGWYRGFAYIEVTVAAIGQYIQGSLQQNNTTNWSSDNMFSTRASGGLCWRTHALLFLNAGDFVNLKANSSTAYGIITTGNLPPCHLEMDYLGTG